MKNSDRLERYVLRYALAPLVVYILALVILESGGLGFAGGGQPFPRIAAETLPPTASLALEHARVNWLSAVLLFGVLAFSVLAACVVVMRNALTARGFKTFLWIGAGLAVVGLVQLWVSSLPNSSLGVIFRFSFSGMHASGRFPANELAAIATLVSVVNILAATVPAFVVLAGCSLLVVPAGGGPADPRQFLRRRMTQLKTLTDLGSALLVAGALHMLLWLRWPMALAGDPAMQKAVGEWALAVTMYCGTAYTLMIAAFYVPCSWGLGKNAEVLLRRALPEWSETELADWLEQYGFSAAPIRQLPQIIATLAPMLAGPIGSVISGLGGAAG